MPSTSTDMIAASGSNQKSRSIDRPGAHSTDTVCTVPQFAITHPSDTSGTRERG